MILSADTLKKYNEHRKCADKSLVCHAPFVNLNFEQTGDVRACCYNFKHVLGKWPAQSIKEIWAGESLKNLRSFIGENSLGGGCVECGNMIESGNYQGTRALYYDEFAPTAIHAAVAKIKNSITGNIRYPKVMEFELSNECNLECVMCNGSFSSSIRKNREKLPPIVSPYNEKFVDELEEFIPHLTDAKFLGGEPFMIEIYLSIWERILKLKPSIRLHITTNGTFLNNRIKDLLEGLNAGIILSIDSVNKDTYRKIRVNGNFEKVLENVEYFRAYTKRKKTFISLAACPMTNNWQELPQLLEFCLEKNIALYFNVVFTPFELSLRELSLDKLIEVIAFLENYTLPREEGGSPTPRNLSIRAYRDFIFQLKGWKQEKEKHQAEMEKHISAPVDTEVIWSVEKMKATIHQIVAIKEDGFSENQRALQNTLGGLFGATPVGKVAVSLGCFIEVCDVLFAQETATVVYDKLATLSEKIEQHPYRNSILKQAAEAPPQLFYQMMREQSLEQLELIFSAQFSAR